MIELACCNALNCDEGRTTVATESRADLNGSGLNRRVAFLTGWQWHDWKRDAKELREDTREKQAAKERKKATKGEMKEARQRGQRCRPSGDVSEVPTAAYLACLLLLDGCSMGSSARESEVVEWVFLRCDDSSRFGIAQVSQSQTAAEQTHQRKRQIAYKTESNVIHAHHHRVRNAAQTQSRNACRQRCVASSCVWSDGARSTCRTVPPRRRAAPAPDHRPTSSHRAPSTTMGQTSQRERKEREAIQRRSIQPPSARSSRTLACHLLSARSYRCAWYGYGRSPVHSVDVGMGSDWDMVRAADGRLRVETAKGQRRHRQRQGGHAAHSGDASEGREKTGGHRGEERGGKVAANCRSKKS